MKKVFKVIGALFLLGLIAIGITYWYAGTSNPWNANRVGDISAPLGYTRVEGSYAEFMHQLPLKKRGSKVQLYTCGNARYLTNPIGHCLLLRLLPQSLLHPKEGGDKEEVCHAPGYWVA